MLKTALSSTASDRSAPVRSAWSGRLRPNRSPQIGASEVRVGEICPLQTDADQIAIGEVSEGEVGAGQIEAAGCWPWLRPPGEDRQNSPGRRSEDLDQRSRWAWGGDCRGAGRCPANVGREHLHRRHVVLRRVRGDAIQRVDATKAIVASSLPSWSTARVNRSVICPSWLTRSVSAVLPSCCQAKSSPLMTATPPSICPIVPRAEFSISKSSFSPRPPFPRRAANCHSVHLQLR